MADNTDYLFREVDEELRRDQLKKLWEQYGTYLIAGVALILVGVGGSQWWQSHRIAAAESAGAQFENALQLGTSGKLDDAAKALQSITKSGPAGYATLARLTLAGDAVKAGKTADAIAEYESIAKSAGNDLIAGFARLQAATLKSDTADFTELQNRLNDLIGDKNPWRYPARELLGIVALRSGKLNEARQMLAPLAVDPRAPEAIRERAGAVMTLLVAAELDKSAPTKVELEPTEPAAAPAEKSAPKKGDAPKAGAAKSDKAGGAKK